MCFTDAGWREWLERKRGPPVFLLSPPSPLCVWKEKHMVSQVAQLLQDLRAHELSAPPSRFSFLSAKNVRRVARKQPFV